MEGRPFCLCPSVTDVHGGFLCCFSDFVSLRVKNRYLLNANLQKKESIHKGMPKCPISLGAQLGIWIKIDVAEVFIGWCPFIPPVFFSAFPIAADMQGTGHKNPI